MAKPKKTTEKIAVYSAGISAVLTAGIGYLVGGMHFWGYVIVWLILAAIINQAWMKQKALENLANLDSNGK